jgi:hypothetical protein
MSPPPPVNPQIDLRPLTVPILVLIPVSIFFFPNRRAIGQSSYFRDPYYFDKENMIGFGRLAWLVVFIFSGADGKGWGIYTYSILHGNWDSRKGFYAGYS